MKGHFRMVIMLLLTLILTFYKVAGQKISYIKIPELEKIIANPENKLFVVNFWASWCPPCVSELPAFEKTYKDYDPGHVRFILISLDFPDQIEKQLIPFLKKNNITIDVAVMTDIDYDSWVDKVDKDWQGDIPATLFFNNSRKLRYFHSGELSESELRKLIDKYI